MSNKMTIKEAALYYLTLEFSVIPVGKDKVPLIRWEKYQETRATKEQVEEWWTQFPDANVGVVTGSVSGIAVVDVETGGDTKDLPPTVMSRTGGGGWHFFYRYSTQSVKNAVRVRDKIDVRGDGGFVVLPPSVHASGNRYEWLVPPTDVDFADLPIWVLEKTKCHEKTDWRILLSSTVLEGSRNMTAAQVAGKLLHHLPIELWELGWETLQTWNVGHNQPPLPENELRDTWESIKKAETAKRAQCLVSPLTEYPRIIQVAKPEREISIDEWRSTIRNNFPELLFPAEMGLSIIAQFLIKEVTNPFALVLVDVPSSGKTITINFFSEIEGLTYATDRFTPASFVSNASNVKKEKLKEIDLLPRLQYKMFLIRDLATLFSKRDDDLNDCIGLLTRVLDGEGLNTESGVHGERHYVGEYLFMILAASTPIPPRVWKMMGNLGSRLFFLTMRTKEKSEDELAGQITTQTHKAKETLCRLATKNFLYTLWYRHREGVEWNKENDPQECKLIIARCARLLAKLRGVINVWKEHTDQGEEYSYTSPVIEKPDRINQLFYNLCRGHVLVCGRTQINRDDLKLVVELAVDSAPTIRARLFRTLLEHNGIMRTSEVEVALQCSKPTALKEMETLKILGVCYFREIGEPEKTLCLMDDFKWFLSDECKEIRGVPTPPRQPTLSDLL